MPGRLQFRSDKLFTLCLIAAAALAVLVWLPAQGQTHVSPTARQAAASPDFAPKLHPSALATRRQGRPSPPACQGKTSPQDEVAYENGPVNGTVDAWTINFGYVVSDSFTLSKKYTLTGYDFWVWEFVGDSALTVDWLISSDPYGGTIYGSGTASLADSFLSTNEYGYNIDRLTVSGMNLALEAGTYYLTLQNATTAASQPVFWDENSGTGCHSAGCPSLAYESMAGTVAGEAFDVVAKTDQLPPPCDSYESTLVYSFTGGEDGDSPQSVTVDGRGNVFGTGYGPTGMGVFEWANGVLSRLYSFAGGVDGDTSSPLVVGPDRTLYGSSDGGLQNCNGLSCGQIFNLKVPPKVCTSALCPWWETKLYQFTGTEDAYSPNNLVFDQAGNLYGLSQNGGAQGKGAIFQLTPALGGGWTEKVIYSFSGGSDGSAPWELLLGMDGNLYGTTQYGGKYAGGTFFELTPAADGWSFAVLYDFNSSLWSLIRDNAGNFYGMAGYTVTMLAPSNDGWTLTELYAIDPWQHGFPLGLAWAYGGVDGASWGTCTGSVHGELFNVGKGYYTTLHQFTYWSPNYITGTPNGGVWGTTKDGGRSCRGAIWRY